METNQNLEGMSVAVLRSDATKPVMRLWDALIFDTATEFADHAEETILGAEIEGVLGTVSNEFPVYVGDELANLVEQLLLFTTFKSQEMKWQPWSKGVRLQMSHQDGGRVRCKLSMGLPSSNAVEGAQEQHGYTFPTNLPWIDQFLVEVRRIAFRYHHARRRLNTP